VPFQFTIIAKTELNTPQKYGNDVFRIIVLHESGCLYKCAVKYNTGGSYTATFTPIAKGTHQLVISVNGTQCPKVETMIAEEGKVLLFELLT
jgi:hypothetical protein